MLALRTSFILFCIIDIAMSYKGLVVMTTGPKSHSNFFSGIIETLIESGHEITLISPRNNLNASKLKHIQIPDERDSAIGNTFEVGLSYVIKSTMRYANFVPNQCVEVLTNSAVADVLREEFDYVLLSIFSTECFLGYIYENKIPLIYATPNSLMTPYSERVGSPEYSSITPSRVSSLTYPLTFWGRVRSLLGDILLTHAYVRTIERRTERLCKERGLWSTEMPSIHYLKKQASLVIINSVRALEIPKKSTPPNVIYAGGIHIHAPSPIPEDLKSWIENWEDGFIIFSLGSAVQPHQMEQRHLDIILRVFETLKQRIVMKWSGNEIENLPNNVKLVSWLPQQDVLAHPNILAFITHGGLLSLLEATYFGVPLVGMPVFGDQMNNVALMEKEGWGKRVQWNELSTESFKSAIVEALTNSSIRTGMKKRSELMRDWPMKPSDDVTFWVDYVIRHDGAKHLQSPFIHMEWYQIHNLDVWIFLTSLTLVIGSISAICASKFLRFIIKRFNKIKVE